MPIICFGVAGTEPLAKRTYAVSFLYFGGGALTLSTTGVHGVFGLGCPGAGGTGPGLDCVVKALDALPNIGMPCVGGHGGERFGGGAGGRDVDMSVGKFIKMRCGERKPTEAT